MKCQMEAPFCVIRWLSVDTWGPYKNPGEKVQVFTTLGLISPFPSLISNLSVFAKNSG